MSEIVSHVIDSATNVASSSQMIEGTIQDFAGNYAVAQVNVIAGLEVNLNNTQDYHYTVDAALGGGTFWGHTWVIEIVDGDGKK